MKKYLESKSLSIVLFLVLFLLYAVVYMTKSMFSSAMATIVEQGFMTKSQTGFINAVFWLFYAIGQIAGGFAADKYSPHKLILFGIAGAIISNIVIYFNQSYSVILIVWALNALAQFGVWPGIFKLVSTQTAPSVRGTAVFWMLFSTSIGLGMSMLVASFVKRWQDNFVVSATSLIIMFLVFVFVYRFLESKMVEKESCQHTTQNEETNEKTAIVPLVMSSGLFAFLIITLLRVAIDNGIKMMTPVMLMESYDSLPASIATRMSTLLVVFSAAGTLIAGFMKRRITSNEVSAQIILYGASLPLLFCACMIGKIHYFFVLASLCVSVAFIHGASPFNQSFVALRFEKYGRIGTVSGILNALASAGNIMASYIFAKMAEYMAWDSVCAIWLAVIIFCVIICVIILPRWTKFIKGTIKI